MWPFRRRGTSSVIERPEEKLGPELPSLEQLDAEIERLRRADTRDPRRERDRRLLELRHLAGIQRLDNPPANPSFAEPAYELIAQGEPLPEISRKQLTPELMRAGILRNGCVLVRGLIPREVALDLAADIDLAYDDRQRFQAGQSPDGGYYEEFVPHARFGEVQGRSWIEQGGGLLAADSPRIHFEMMEQFLRAGLRQLVSGYLGEPALITVHKTTLRRAEPSVPGAWHQDGKFMGPVRSLNLWLSLSRCGDESPGLDIVPRRLDGLVTAQTEEAILGYQISPQKVEEAAGEVGILRPIFEPGDALFFDELFLHQTGSDPDMPKPRYAIENWFFGGSAFPGEYAPIAV